MNAEMICAAFCAPVALNEVPIGYALRTPFRRADGDAVSIYLRRDSEDRSRYRLEDDGQIIGFLEASGVDLETETRQEALADLLREHGAFFDETECVLHTDFMPEKDVPAAAVSFSALLLRVIDLLLLARNRVRSTFREDLIQMVENQS